MKKTMLFAALLVSMTAVAQERAWTLSDCIDYALEHNLSVQQSGINVEQQEIALNTAESNRLPGLSGSAGQNFSFGRGLTADNTYANTNTTSTSFSLGGDLTIVNGKEYVLDGAIYDLKADAKANGDTVKLTLRLNGDQDLPVEIKVSNITGMNGAYIVPANGELTLEGKFVNAKVPYVGLVIPNGNLGDKVEFIDERLK